MTDKIALSPGTLLDELLWQATRYCIGRRSYVSTYAQDYARIIRRNRDLFNQDRLRFYARDIRAEISNHISHYGNVQVENAYNDCIKYDAYTLLYKHLKNFPEAPYDKKYTVDCVSGEITEKAYKPDGYPIYFNPKEWESDLRPWVLLANSIDRRYMITCKRDGQESTSECTVDPEGRYTCTDNWNRHPITELITDITPIDK